MIAAPSSVQAKANPRYAGLVIDTDNGTVLYEENARVQRHPASLTKMMTLYMAFEAIEKGKLSMNQQVRVSARAAKQPQTNIGLRQGDRISVKNLIDSLIVRSANDSAVVMAEAIGKTEWNFALMMTKKAQQLGMRNTRFRNASGLHDANQVTTAYDMAKLGLALRRNFPHRYNLFKNEKFTYGGRSYYSHNKVTRYYRGADGIKTGYIRASGFNLVTTASRDGHNLIAVVLGGKTSRSRDNHMISLLDRSFKKMDKHGRFTLRFASALPKPISKPSSSDILLAALEDNTPDTDAAEKTTTPAKSPVAIVVSEADSQNALSAFAPLPKAKPDEGVIIVANDNSPSQPDNKKTVAIPSPKQVATPVLKPKGLVLASHTPTPGNAQNLGSPKNSRITQSNANARHNPIWGIQVGTFSSARDAMMAASNAMNIAEQPLKGSRIHVANSGSGNAPLHRARISGLSEAQARLACRELTSARESCFVFRSHFGKQL